MYDSLLPGTGGTPEVLGPLVTPPARGPLSGPDVFLCNAPDRLFPPIAGDELLEGGLEENVGEALCTSPDRSLKEGIGGGT